MKKLIEWIKQLLFGGSEDYLLKKYNGSVVKPSEVKLKMTPLKVRIAEKLLKAFLDSNSWSEYTTEGEYDSVPGSNLRFTIWCGVCKQSHYCFGNVFIDHFLMRESDKVWYLTTAISSADYRTVVPAYISSVLDSVKLIEGNHYMFQSKLFVILSLGKNSYCKFPVTVSADISFEDCDGHFGKYGKVTILNTVDDA